FQVDRHRVGRRQVDADVDRGDRRRDHENDQQHQKNVDKRDDIGLSIRLHRAPTALGAPRGYLTGHRLPPVLGYETNFSETHVRQHVPGANGIALRQIRLEADMDALIVNSVRLVGYLWRVDAHSLDRPLYKLVP